MVMKKMQAKALAGKIKPGKGRPGNRKIEVLSSKLSYDGPLFQVYTDQIRENGVESCRDVIRHGGSVVILALDDALGKPDKRGSGTATRDPLVILERQYRHAARGYLLEVPAGKLEPGERHLAGAKRELAEETGFRARRWRKLVRYFASPGFLGEWMVIFVAEELTAGPTRPDNDEQIEIQKIPFSQLLRMTEEGKIHDGKTLIAAQLYDSIVRRATGGKRNKK